MRSSLCSRCSSTPSSSPIAYVYLTTVYAEPSSGYALFSWEFVLEMRRGLKAAVPPAVWIAVPFLLLAAAMGVLGFVRLLRANWVIAMALVLPAVLTAALIVFQGLSVSPRFFLIAIFPAILSIVLGVEHLAERWAPVNRRAFAPARITAAVMAAGAAISLTPLRHYYDTPATLPCITRVPAKRTRARGPGGRGPSDRTRLPLLRRAGRAERHEHVLRSHRGELRPDTRAPSRQPAICRDHPASRFAHDLSAACVPSRQRMSGGAKVPATIGDGDIVVWRVR